MRRGALHEWRVTDDVAKAVVSAVCDPSTAGKTYSLAGPGIYTQAELAQIVFDGTPEERGAAVKKLPLHSPSAA